MKIALGLAAIVFVIYGGAALCLEAGMKISFPLIVILGGLIGAIAAGYAYKHHQSEQQQDVTVTFPQIPDLRKATKTVITSLDQFEPNSTLTESKTTLGVFELSAYPSNPPYSDSEVKTKQFFNPNIYISVKMVPDMILDKSKQFWHRNATTLELVGIGIYFIISCSNDQYDIWESDPLSQTGWRPLRVTMNQGFNTFSMRQAGKSISVWVNDSPVDTFMKEKETTVGPVGIKLKANFKTGGKTYFKDLTVWELSSPLKDKLSLWLRRLWS